MKGRHVDDSLSVISIAPRTAHFDDAVSTFLRVRSRLFGIAYRMLDDLTEAEDIVQDVWVRWQTTDRSRVRNATTFLVAATTRLAINVLHSARVRRQCGAPRLTEPIDPSGDPAFDAELAEAVKLGLLLLLEKLSPNERAAYVLRKAFNYSYCEIASILQAKEANVRQLVNRARQHLSTRRRASASSTEQRRLLSAFSAASKTGDMTRLERLLVSDVVSNSAKRVAASSAQARSVAPG